MPAAARTATVAIAVLTALVSLIVGFGAVGVHGTVAMGFIPARIGGMPVPFDAVPAILTPLTATLVHGGLAHLFFNLFMFVYCGLAVERILGRGALVFVYLVSAYAAMIAQYVADPMSLQPVIGASGAISGVIGAYALSFGRAKMVTRNLRLNRWINILWLAAAWAVLQLVIGWSAGQGGVMLATPAHIGGFVAGLLMQRPLLMWRYRKA